MIKHKQAIAWAAIAALGAALPSCSKYPDGPKLSLKSPTARLAREWEVKSVDDPSYPEEIEVIFDFDEDGDVKYELMFDYGYGQPVTYTIKGEWEWLDKKEVLELDFDGRVWEMTVKRLTTDELEWEDQDGYDWELRAN